MDSHHQQDTEPELDFSSLELSETPKSATERRANRNVRRRRSRPSGVAHRAGANRPRRSARPKHGSPQPRGNTTEHGNGLRPTGTVEEHLIELDFVDFTDERKSFETIMEESVIIYVSKSWLLNVINEN
ncbi:hypothetical protein ACJZ2D_014363 [Fusarium nematophilum]